MTPQQVKLEAAQNLLEEQALQHQLLMSILQMQKMISPQKNLFFIIKQLYKKYHPNSKSSSFISDMVSSTPNGISSKPNLNSRNNPASNSQNYYTEILDQDQHQIQDDLYQIDNIEKVQSKYLNQQVIDGQFEYIIADMNDIHRMHRDKDFWEKQSLFTMLYASKLNDQSVKRAKSNDQQQNVIQSQQLQKIRDIKREQIQQKVKIKHPNLIDQNFSFPEKLVHYFSLYNRALNAKRFSNTHLQWNKLRQQTSASGVKDQIGPNMMSEYHQNFNQEQNLGGSSFRKNYMKKLQKCKQCAHAFVYSGYGFRKMLSHGFQMTLMKYRTVLQQIIRVVFRLMEKFVFQSQMYKSKHNLHGTERQEYIQQMIGPSDNPSQRIPHRQFKLVLIQLYNMEINLPKSIYQTFHKLIKITYGLQATDLQNQVRGVEYSVNQQEMVDCYQAVRKLIKERVMQRMQRSMKIHGLGTFQWKKVKKQMVNY